MFLIDLVPCQNSGSLSMSDKTFQTSETGASIFFDVWKLANTLSGTHANI